MKTLSTCILLLLSASIMSQPGGGKIIYRDPVFADTGRVEKIRKALPIIDEMCKNYAAAIHAPGLSYGLMVDGKLVLTGATGFADPEQKIAATTQTGFRIASMTKSFTAMAILKLRDEGKLDLDDAVADYVLGFSNHHLPSGDAPVITIRHLLMHAAGLPQDDPSADRQLAFTNEELEAFISKGLSYSTTPGTAYEYSNIGYMTLGLVITKATGMPYQDYIRKNILQPLGMTQTYWEHAEIPSHRFAKGYRWLNGKWVAQPILHDGAGGAMGGLITNVEDFGKYMAFHLSAWPPSGGEDMGPVRRSTLREMQKPWNIPILNAEYRYPSGRACPTVTAYGYGLRWTKDCENRVSVAHSGGLPGYGSIWQIMPEYGVGIVVMANVTYAPAWLLATRVLDTLVTLAELEPRRLVPSSILLERQQQLVSLLPSWKEVERSGIFAGNFFQDYLIDSLRKEAETLFASAGKIIRVEEIVPLNALRGNFILRGEKADIEVRFTLSPDRIPRIQAYGIRELKK